MVRSLNQPKEKMLTIMFMAISMLTEECSDRKNGKMRWLSRDDDTQRTFPLDLDECQDALVKRFGQTTGTLIMATLKVQMQAPLADPDICKQALEDIYKALHMYYLT